MWEVTSGGWRVARRGAAFIPLQRALPRGVRWPMEARAV